MSDALHLAELLHELAFHNVLKCQRPITGIAANPQKELAAVPGITYLDGPKRCELAGACR